MIDTLCKSKLVEKIVYKMATAYHLPKDNLEDFVQNVYLILLEKPRDFINDLIERDEIGFYIIRIVRNQLFSVTSPFYREYVLPEIKKTDIENAITIEVPSVY